MLRFGGIACGTMLFFGFVFSRLHPSPYAGLGGAAFGLIFTTWLFLPRKSLPKRITAATPGQLLLEMARDQYKEYAARFNGNLLESEEFIRTGYIKAALSKGDTLADATNHINFLIRIGRREYLANGGLDATSNRSEHAQEI
jgi:hypothetical protein